MFIDTSVFVEILSSQPDARRFELVLERHAKLFTSALVRLETMMALTKFNLGTTVQNNAAFDAMVEVAGIQFLDITDSVGKCAVEAFAQFGKGQKNPAQLNLSDCMSYAVAKHYRLPILFKGADFSKTDLELVAF